MGELRGWRRAWNALQAWVFGLLVLGCLVLGTLLLLLMAGAIPFEL